MIVFKYLALIMLPVLASAESYRYAGEFLRLGAGARAAGMGNSVVPVIDDASATYWNPAGLAALQQREAAFMHSEQFGNVMNYDVVNYALPVKGVGGIGITLLRLGMDNIIPQTSVADPSLPVSADNPILVDRYLSSSDYALLLGHGMQFRKFNIRGGVTVKFIRREIGDYYAHGIGADLGLQYPLPGNGMLGCTVKDVTGSIIAWDNGTRDYVTPSFLLGVSYSGWVEELRGNLTATGSLCPDALLNRIAAQAGTSPFERYLLGPVIAGGAGLEYDFKRKIFIRAGTVDRDITAGLGIRVAGFAADYALTLYNMFESSAMHDDLNRTHRISGAYRF